MRTFDTGATRDTDETKPDYEGFLSPLAIKRFGEYMTLHRKQADGKLRASDNWQKGIPLETYIKSLCRHVEDLKLHHDGYPGQATDPDVESVLSASLFNVQGYLHETVKARLNKEAQAKAVKEIIRQMDDPLIGTLLPFCYPPDRCPCSSCQESYYFGRRYGGSY